MDQDWPASLADITARIDAELHAAEARLAELRSVEQLVDRLRAAKRALHGDLDADAGKAAGPAADQATGPATGGVWEATRHAVALLLADRDELTTREIIDETGIKQSRVYPAIQRHRWFNTRTRDDGVSLWSLTETGKSAARHLRAGRVPGPAVATEETSAATCP